MGKTQRAAVTGEEAFSTTPRADAARCAGGVSQRGGGPGQGRHTAAVGVVAAEGAAAAVQ
eukprot:365557-Chlamydomonas_euryale.AAC.11